MITGCNVNIPNLDTDIESDFIIDSAANSKQDSDIGVIKNDITNNKIHEYSNSGENIVVISRYYGSLRTENDMVSFRIDTKQLGAMDYVVDLLFYEYASEMQIQHIRYALRDDFMPETIKNGYQIIDVNNDGSDDIILHLGIYGKRRIAVCFIYDPEQQCYCQLSGYDELFIPTYSRSEGIVYEEWIDMPEYAINKYRVEGNDLILVASLYWTYNLPEKNRYTEKVLIYGEMITIKENVSEGDIDSSWWNDIHD